MNTDEDGREEKGCLPHFIRAVKGQFAAIIEAPNDGLHADYGAGLSEGLK